MRKSLLVILSICLLAAAGYFGYDYWTKRDSGQEAAAPALKRLVADKVISPVASTDLSAIWYGLSDGRLRRVEIVSGESAEYPLPPARNRSFSEIFWPQEGSDFIAQGLDGLKTVFSYFDSAAGKYVDLPDNVQTLGWLPDNKRVALVWRAADGKASLVVSDADASGYRVVSSLPWVDMDVYPSPVENKALLMRYDPAALTSKIYLFDLQTGQYKEAVKDGANTGVKWSPSGNYFAYTRQTPTGSQVWVHDMAGGQDWNTGLFSTIPRLDFTADGSRMFASTINENGKEEIRSVDLATHDSSVLYGESFGFRSMRLFVVGQKAYFIGVEDGGIYTIE